ncbi:leucine-rich repeat domain-containing protein [candidate division KSB1 bacterium]
MTTFPKRIYWIIAALYMLFLSGCDLSETVGVGSAPPVACFGEDQTSRVGQYVTLDGSASTAGEGGIIVGWEWGQDENNPDELFFHHTNDDFKREVGFDTEGLYQFFLTVTNNFGTKSEPGATTITVLPREKIVFDDANLEVCVRRTLDMSVEDLTAEILQSIETLFLHTPRSARIKSFSGLELCVNLEDFNGSGQDVVNLSPITNLTKMRELDLESNEIIDISPLAGMIELRELWLGGNNIADISALAGMTKLEYLNLEFTPVTDISALASMTELKRVFFSHATFGDISPVSGLINLDEFFAFDCNIQNIPELDNLINLRQLRLDNNKITNISSLSNLTSLIVLELSSNRITDISVVKYLTKLNSLHLSGNQIEDILPIVENTGIGKFDTVSLKNNPLNEQSINEYIPALQNRGVWVSY